MGSILLGGMEAEVLFASLTDANSCIKVSVSPLTQFVEVDACHVVVSKQRMFCANRLYPHAFRNLKHNLLQHTRALMSVDDIDMFSNQNLSHYRV